MTYKVVKFFTDLHDKDHPYNVGDTFPREGMIVSESRYAELAGSDNKQGEPLIRLVEEMVEEKPKKPTTKRKKKTAEN
jgi:hypothetical protein